MRYLIKGDVSGIQRFIFNVNSKGAAKSLKGRSFFIKMLLEVSMLKIFDELGTSRSMQKEAKISTSGGNFILQLDTNEPEKIRDIQRQLSQALQYSGLNMVLGYVAWDGREATYRDALKTLHRETRERKFDLLVEYDDFFEAFDREEISAINGMPNKKEGLNKKWHAFTDAISKSKFVTIKKIDEASHCFSLKGRVFDLIGYRVGFSSDKVDENNFDCVLELENYLESIFPERGGDAKTFADLSFGGGYFSYKSNSGKPVKKRGINKLAVLAMDVDDLGKAVEEMRSVDVHREFDQKLQNFFNIQLKEIINEGKFKNNVYTVTAGGDDSYFVGKWNTMIDLAVAIYDAFSIEFSGEKLKSIGIQSKLTISAGIVIVHPNFPVVRFAYLANKAIRKAKDFYDRKGNICLFGEVLSWKVLKEEIKDLRTDFNKRGRDLISSGLLAKARHIAVQMSEREAIKLSDFWELGYFMRNIRKGGNNFFWRKYQDLMKKSAFQEDSMLRRNYRLVFPIAARLAELDNR